VQNGPIEGIMHRLIGPIIIGEGFVDSSKAFYVIYK